MKTLFIECNMGAAGDMLMSSLLELIEDQENFVKILNNIGLLNVEIEKSKISKCGILGTHIDVSINNLHETSKDIDIINHNHNHSHSDEFKHSHEEVNYKNKDHEHAHNNMEDIKNIINNLKVSDLVKNNSIEIYKLIAKAESKAHGKLIDEVHFHEVGAIDAIVDIVGSCMLIEMISPEIIISSPIHLGSGFVECAHGVLPVPAPATAYILQNVPVYSGKIKGELCTPTGAAILKYFVDEFKEMPMMEIEKIGYGMGSKDFEIANCVRTFIGETELGKIRDEIVELTCNLDDMTGEEIGFVSEILFKNNALDVYTISIQMKKNRPGILLVCLCNLEDSDEISRLILKHTTSFGLRKKICEKYMLERNFVTVKTKFGDIRKKIGKGFGIEKYKYEYDDVAKIAKDNNLSIFDFYNNMQEDL